MKKIFVAILSMLFVLSITGISFAATAPVSEQLVTSSVQKVYLSEVFGIDVIGSEISVVDLSSSMARNSAFPAKAIKSVKTLDDGTIEVCADVLMVEDASGNLVNAFTIDPNYLANSAGTYASRSTSYTENNFPDIRYQVRGYYTQEVINSTYVYRLTSATFKWWRADSSTSYKMNKIDLVAAVCGDLYTTSMVLVQEDFEDKGHINKTNPTENTTYNTGTIMSSSGPVITIGGYGTGASLDWQYWVNNSMGTNVRDINSLEVFGP